MTTAATIQKPTAPQPLLSAGTHIAAALAVAGFVALAWGSAGQASQQAVATNTAAMTRTVTYITLPAVAITAPRAVKVSALSSTGAI